jgi:hypothetical protein
VTELTREAEEAVRVEVMREVVLGRGSMQNWSDLDLGSVADAPVVRSVLEQATAGARSVLVAGAHSLELLAGLAQRVDRLTVVTRSITDAQTVWSALRDAGTVSVHAGEVAGLHDSGERHDLVLALDDLDRLVSVEAGSAPWDGVLADLVRLLEPGGRLLLGVESELGLHRLSALRSRYAADDDGDWAVLATYDASRPRTEQAVRDAVTAAGLRPRTVLASYADWLRPVCLGDRLVEHRGLCTLAGHLAVSAPARQGSIADPTRVTRVATAAGLLPLLASGWLVDAVGVPDGDAGPVAPEPPDAPSLVLETPEGVVRFQPDRGPDADAVRRVGEGGASHGTLNIDASCVLFSEQFVDACAAHDLVAVRRLLRRHVEWLSGAAEDGLLDGAHAAAGPANLLVGGPTPQVIVPAPRGCTLDHRIARTLVELVSTLRTRGTTHPWPAATDDATLVAVLASMAGVPCPQEPVEPLRRATDPGARHEVAALLAVVRRLEEANAAVAGQAAWFERRLDERERQLRTIHAEHDRQLRAEQARQESLRRAMADVKSSTTFRAGRVVTAPVQALRSRARRLAATDDAGPARR